MAKVFIPKQMRDLTGGQAEIEVVGRNVRQVVAALDEAFPGIAARLTRGDRMAPGLAVAIDNNVSSLGLLAPVPPESEVHFVMSISGG